MKKQLDKTVTGSEIGGPEANPRKKCHSMLLKSSRAAINSEDNK